MTNLIQPKYQTEPLPSAPEPTNWASDGAARKRKVPINQSVGPAGIGGRVLNELPPGTDIAAQSLTDQPDAPFSMADASDAAPAWNRRAVLDGYTLLKVKPGCTEDVPFDAYGDATVEGKTGAVERRNILDRL